MLQMQTLIKSSASITNCVGVELMPHGGVEVADTKDPAGMRLQFSADEWRAFVVGVKRDEFDLPD